MAFAQMALLKNLLIFVDIVELQATTSFSVVMYNCVIFDWGLCWVLCCDCAVLDAYISRLLPCKWLRSTIRCIFYLVLEDQESMTASYFVSYAWYLFEIFGICNVVYNTHTPLSLSLSLRITRLIYQDYSYYHVAFVVWFLYRRTFITIIFVKRKLVSYDNIWWLKVSIKSNKASDVLPGKCNDNWLITSASGSFSI